MDVATTHQLLKECLRTNYIYIKENVDATKLVDYLYQNKAIDNDEKEEIMNPGKSRRDKNECLLHKMSLAPIGNTLDIFFESLRKYQSGLYEYLQDYLKNKQDNKLTKCQNYKEDNNNSFSVAEGYSRSISNFSFQDIEDDGDTSPDTKVEELPNVSKATDEDLQHISKQQVTTLLETFSTTLQSLNTEAGVLSPDDVLHILRLICFNTNTIPILESHRHLPNIVESLAKHIIDSIKLALQVRQRKTVQIPLPLLVTSLERIIDYHCSKYDCSDGAAKASKKKSKFENMVLELFAALMSDNIHPTISKEEMTDLQKSFFILVFKLVKDKRMWERKRDLKEVQQILQDNVNHSNKVIRVLSHCLHQIIQEGHVESAEENIKLTVQWLKEASTRKKLKADNGLDAVLLLAVLETFCFKDHDLIKVINADEFVDFLIKLLQKHGQLLNQSESASICSSVLVILYTAVTQLNYPACSEYTYNILDGFTEYKDDIIKVTAAVTMSLICLNNETDMNDLNDDVLEKLLDWLSRSLITPNKKFGRGFYAKNLMESLQKIADNVKNLSKIRDKIIELQESVKKQDDQKIKAIYDTIRAKMESMSKPTFKREPRLSYSSGATVSYSKENAEVNIFPKESERNIDILLVGKTGNGKSATGNTILGRDKFECLDSTQSVTSNVQYEYAYFKGRTIKVVDGPGFEDTDNMDDLEKTIEVMIDKMQDAVIQHPKGYHAFLLVVRYGGRFTKEDKRVVEMLKSIFGQQIVKDYCILLMTHGDIFRYKNKNKKYKKWCSEQSGVFKELLEECGNRVVLFENHGEDAQIKEKQMEKLIQTIDKLQYNGRRYCGNHFKAAEERRQCLLVECKEPRVTERIRKECSLLLEKCKAVYLYGVEEQASELQKLLGTAEKLKLEVLQKDQGTRVLTTAIDLTSHLYATIESQQNILNIKREKSKFENEKEKITQNYEDKLKHYKTEISRQKSIEELHFRNSQEYEKMAAEFSQDKDQIKQLETKIQELEEKLNEQIETHKSKLGESEKKYEEMIQEMTRKYDELQVKYDTLKGKKRKNMCKQQ